MSVFLVILTSCELDATDVEGYGEDRCPIVYCVADVNNPIEVYVMSSVSFSSSSSTSSAVDYASVLLTYNDNASFLHLIQDSTSLSTTFSEVSPTYGDKLTLDIETMDYVLSAQTVIPTPVSISALDTVTTQDQKRLRFTLTMTDDLSTDDYYQIELRRRTYSNGTSQDTTLSTTYSNYIFQTVSTIVGNQTQSIGLFSDADQSVATYHLNFSALWTDILPSTPTSDASSNEPDSTVVAVRLYHHSSDYFSFLQTSQQTQEYTIIPVFGNATVYTNISGGGYGIVAGLAYDEKLITVSSNQ